MSYARSVESAEAAAEQTKPRPATIKDFIHIAKPGILFSNSITTFAGFWLASQGTIDWMLMLFTLLGTVLVMASGCVLNNYLDRDMDIKMSRTRERALPTGVLSPSTVLIYGILLGVAGLALLGLGVHTLAALLGLLGLFFYVWVYTAWLKRTSVWSTAIGGVSGAIPPVIGYCAVHGSIDVNAWILFAIMYLWQPPHFWALGIRRLDDYRNAGYPLLPVVQGVPTTKISMMRYVVPLVPVSMLLYFTGSVGPVYLFVSAVLGLYWIYLTIQGFRVETGSEAEERWAKKNFLFSVNYLTILFLVMVLTTITK